MESKSEKWQVKRIGIMSFINDECDNVKQFDKWFFTNIIRNIFLEVIADFKELEEEKNTTVTKVFDDVIQIEYAFCSKCNEQLNNVLNNENYCPNCGRKIKK